MTFNFIVLDIGLIYNNLLYKKKATQLIIYPLYNTLQSAFFCMRFCVLFYYCLYFEIYILKKNLSFTWLCFLNEENYKKCFRDRYKIP